MKTSTPINDGEYKEWIAPKRARWLELREDCITSTEIAPVAGISKYGNNRFSIYHTKRGELEDSFVPNQRSEIGLDIENAIAKMTARKLGVHVMRYADFANRDKLGASFDYEIDHRIDDEGDPEYHEWLVEIKNVDYWIFSDQWGKDSQGRYTPPEHIILQTQAQLEVSRRPGCLLSVLVGGNDLKLIPIARDVEFGAALRKIANEFWVDIEEGNEPEVIAEDAKNALALYSYADPSHVLDATEDDVLSHKIASYKELKEKAKAIEAEANALKAQVVVEIGDASKIFCMDGYTLDAGITKGNPGREITQEQVGDIVGARKEFRRFTVRIKKGAK
jgi:predicted phage-related endonuclease